MNAKQFIELVNFNKLIDWRNSEIWIGPQCNFEDVAAHLEKCESCRKKFDRMMFPENTLEEFEPRIRGKSQGFICDVEHITLKESVVRIIRKVLVESYNVQSNDCSQEVWEYYDGRYDGVYLLADMAGILTSDELDELEKTTRDEFESKYGKIEA